MISEYKRAATVEEALDLGRKGYVFLAGGTQVNSAPFKKYGKAVEKVVSLDGLELGGIVEKKGQLIIGAMTTLQEIADSPVVPEFLRRAASFIPTRSVRNIATIGGNVGANRSDSYIIPSLMASEAQAETAEGKTIPVEEYVKKGRDDLILRFFIPVPEGITIALKESRSHLALPVVSAAVRIVGEKGKLERVLIAAGCLSSRCIRLESVEKALIRGELSDGPELEEALVLAVDPVGDIKGSADYKRYINSVRIADAVRQCLKGESL